MDNVRHGGDVFGTRPHGERRVRVPFAKIVEALVIPTGAVEEIIERRSMNLRVSAEVRVRAGKAID